MVDLQSPIRKLFRSSEELRASCRELARRFERDDMVDIDEAAQLRALVRLRAADHAFQRYVERHELGTNYGSAYVNTLRLVTAPPGGDGLFTRHRNELQDDAWSYLCGWRAGQEGMSNLDASRPFPERMVFADLQIIAEFVLRSIT